MLTSTTTKKKVFPTTFVARETFEMLCDIFHTFHQSVSFQLTRLQPEPGRPIEMSPSEKCESVERIKVHFCSVVRIFKVLEF